MYLSNGRCNRNIFMIEIRNILLLILIDKRIWWWLADLALASDNALFKVIHSHSMLFSLDYIILFQGHSLTSICHGNLLYHTSVLTNVLTFWVIHFQWGRASRSLCTGFQVLEKDFVFRNRVEWTAWSHLLLNTFT